MMDFFFTVGGHSFLVWCESTATLVVELDVTHWFIVARVNTSGWSLFLERHFFSSSIIFNCCVAFHALIVTAFKLERLWILQIFCYWYSAGGIELLLCSAAQACRLARRFYHFCFYVFWSFTSSVIGIVSKMDMGVIAVGLKLATRQRNG